MDPRIFPFRSPPASAAPAALPAASPGAFSPDCEVQGARATRRLPGGRRCLSWTVVGLGDGGGIIGMVDFSWDFNHQIG